MTEENKFTEVPTRFVSKTMYNPKMVLVHLDQMKDCIQELQSYVLQIGERLNQSETKKSKKE
jgi:hypothetical protein